MWDYLVAQDSTGAEGVFRRFYGKVEEVTMNIRTLQDASGGLMIRNWLNPNIYIYPLIKKILL